MWLTTMSRMTFIPLAARRGHQAAEGGDVAEVGGSAS